MSALLLAGCADEEATREPYRGPPIPWAYQAFPATESPADNPESEAKVGLGRLLFYDPILSSDRAVACATCHSEVWGLSDGLPLSVGVGGIGPTGPGRTGPNLTRRNAPTLWNVAQKRALFWDGRVASLEEQALVPLGQEKELGRPPEEVAADLAAIPEYATRFEAAFHGSTNPVNPKNIGRALGAFERTFLSNHAPYDQYVAGDAGALDSETVRGMFLFAEAGCASCHAPPLFESERYADRGVVSQAPDLGREEISHASADANAFHVPTLRNVRDSGPFFHDGSVTELADAVAHEAARSHADGDARALADDELAAITRFLDKALTDRIHQPVRPNQVPSGLPVPVDGFRVPR